MDKLLKNLFEIKQISQIIKNNFIQLPELPGIYAFWWIGEIDELLNSNRTVMLKGPGGARIEIEYKNWWPKEILYPCLYVGKSTNIKNRFSQHILRKKLSRLHSIPDSNEKQKPHTTSCQLRYGIEHIFKNDDNPLEIIINSVGFSYSTDFPYNSIVERFYEEDRLIGTWRPWFNIDSER